MDKRSVAVVHKNDEDGDIRCGNCGATIAKKLISITSVDQMGIPVTYLCWLVFERGWLPNNEGIWRLTNYAKRQRAHNRTPSVRRQSKRELIATALQLASDRAVYGTRSQVMRRLSTWQVPKKLPLRAECARCNSIQFCIPSLLNVEEEVSEEMLSKAYGLKAVSEISEFGYEVTVPVDPKYDLGALFRSMKATKKKES